MKKKALSILLALLLTLTACVTAATPEGGIQSLTLERGSSTAQVTLTAAEENTLLVAVYDADQKMVALGVQPVAPGKSTVSVTLTAPAPYLFQAEAFLLNDSQAPACESVLLDRSAETPTPPAPTTRTLVAYFSATNTTEGVAEKIATALGDGRADLYEIVPEVPYTSADLNYNTDCRANREQNDPSARPAIAESSKVDNMEQYDVIFLGYPIWWGQAPKIMYTFLERYDFNGKTVVPFCTSGSSGMGSSATNLAKTATGATWLSGNRFSGGVSQSTVQTWVDGLDLNLSR